MFFQLPGGLTAAVLIAVTPAVFRWWRGRALAPLAEDPVLPERLAAHHARCGQVAGVCAGLLLFTAPAWGIWTLPLLVLAWMTAGFPLRKVLYQETWRLRTYLSFFGRLIVGVLGLWMLLAATPWLASRAGRADWIAGLGLALILILWNRYSSAIARRLWRTQPMTDPALVSRFTALVATCGLPMPRFEWVSMQGGVFANAVAMPALRGSSVVVTETLLSRLSEDETIAICAHELAHLEHFDRARLRKANVASLVLIAAAAATAPLARVWSGSPGPGPFLWIWPSAVVLALFQVASRRQKNETASDLRAVALTGDAEALARALIALHAIARVPRRWGQERERQSTHPSLARRIRDIRASAGVAAATLDVSTVFREATGAAQVTFDAAHLSWQDAIGATHVLDYAGLVELRLNVSAAGVVMLVAVERQERRWQMVPRVEDLPALQRVLDIVDGRLTHETPARPFSPAAARLVAVLGCVIAFAISQFAFGFVALLASVSPVPSLLNGAAAAALAAAALLLRDGLPTDATSAVAASVFAALGAALLGVSWVRRAESSRTTGPLLAILGAGAILGIAIIGFGGLSSVRLHQGARATPAALILLVALATACWTWRNRPAFRHAAIAATLACAGVAVLGSTLFLDRAVRDPFLVKAPPAAWTTLDHTAAVEFEVPFEVESLRLSPTGRLVAIRRSEDDDSNDAKVTSLVFHVGRPGAALSQVQAADFTFIDDRRALILVVHDKAAEVREVNFDGAPLVVWHEPMPDLRWGTIGYEAQGNRWIVLGRDAADQLVRAVGTVGAAGAERTTWNTTPERGHWMDGAATHGDTALVVDKHFVFGSPGLIALRAFAPFLMQPFGDSQIRRFRDGQRIGAEQSLLDTTCVSGALADGGLVCAAYDGTRTRIVAIETGSGTVRGLTSIDGHFRPDEAATQGWLTGWAGATPVALRLATHEAIRPPTLRWDGEFVATVAATDAVIATAAWKDGGSRIRLYPLR
jgi:Zn-dependent protease with chaperone function